MNILLLGHSFRNVIRLIQLASGIWHLRLWCAVICDPGAKKSPALAAATRPLREAQRDLQRAYQKACAASDTPDRPRMQQRFTVNTTREGLTALLEDNPRGLALIADELASWVLSLNQYRRGKGNDRQFWLSLWSGAELLVNRARDRGRPTAYVRAPMLTVLGCLPPAALDQLQEEVNREDGFVHRILLSWPDPAPFGWTDAEPDRVAQESYAKLFRRLWALELPLDPETGDVRPRLLNWTEKGRLPWVAFVNRLAQDLTHPVFPPCLRGPWAKIRGLRRSSGAGPSFLSRYDARDSSGRGR